jgi:hypothetical protein
MGEDHLHVPNHMISGMDYILSGTVKRTSPPSFADQPNASSSSSRCAFLRLDSSRRGGVVLIVCS